MQWCAGHDEGIFVLQEWNHPDRLLWFAVLSPHTREDNKLHWGQWGCFEIVSTWKQHTDFVHVPNVKWWSWVYLGTACDLLLQYEPSGSWRKRYYVTTHAVFWSKSVSLLTGWICKPTSEALSPSKRIIENTTLLPFPPPLPQAFGEQMWIQPQACNVERIQNYGTAVCSQKGGDLDNLRRMGEIGRTKRVVRACEDTDRQRKGLCPMRKSGHEWR